MLGVILMPLHAYQGGDWSVVSSNTVAETSSNKAVRLSNSFGFMSDIRDTGNLILDVGMASTLGMDVINRIMGSNESVANSSTIAAAANVVVTWLGASIMPVLMLMLKLLTYLMVLGFTLAFVVPALPFMFFLIATISYLIFFAEAIVALPLTAVGLAHPDGQGPLSQVSGKAVFLVLRLMAQPLITLIAFAFAVEATDAVGGFVTAVTLPTMDSAITSTFFGWVGMLVVYTAAILVTVFTIWEIIMGFTNQIFKWIGDVANDLGESKANQMFVGVAGGAKGASTGMANANAMKQNTPKPTGGGDEDKKSGDQNTNAETDGKNK